MTRNIGDHPRGNFWFADRLTEDEIESEADRQFPWRVFIQLNGLVDHLDSGYPTQQAAEQYIRDDILGAGAEFECESDG